MEDTELTLKFFRRKNLHDFSSDEMQKLQVWLWAKNFNFPTENFCRPQELESCKLKDKIQTFRKNTRFSDGTQTFLCKIIQK